MTSLPQPERVNTVVIGGGQAGLVVGYYLRRLGAPFVILEANSRLGDAWRNRWDSLRLFTPACYDGLAGMPFPAPSFAFPTKDEMANYLESYAAKFQLPVRTQMHVDKLSRAGDHFVVAAGEHRFEAENVVVAMSDFQQPRIPELAREIKPEIVQLHSSEYRSPAQLRDGAVLIAGAGNSGAEIALEVARARHHTVMAGRDVGHVPFRIDGIPARLLLLKVLFRVVFHRVLTVDTPPGRRVRPKVTSQGGPLIRVKPQQLTNAGVERAPRVVAAKDGLPVLANGRVLDVANIVWCTGFHPGFSWIDLPVFNEEGAPIHERGVVTKEPGLYFVGLHFLYSFSSTMIHGVSRDAERIARHIAARAPTSALLPA